MSSTRARSLARCAVAAAVLATATARASDGSEATPVESSWRLRVEAGPGFDGNALRIVGDGDPSSAAFTGGSLRAQGRLASPRWTMDARLSEGFRLFMGAPDADLLASRLDAAGRWSATRRLTLGLDGMARDLSERGGARDLREAQGLARVGLVAGRVRWDAAGGWMVSAPRAGGLRVFRRDGPELALSAAVQIAREHALIAGVSAWAWRYRDWPGGRDDDEGAASLEWRWDGPVLTALSYTFGRNASSVDAGSWRRHRVTARIAADLPLGLDVAARANFQRSVNPSGLILSEQLFVREGDESQNALEVQLARELRAGVEIALKVAHYRSELGAEEAGLAFRRTVAQLSVAWTTGN
ncbi:MAG TPA: hypothetical protein VFK85_15995 [Anaeromyxobacteraceae bacterium]|nr:hypothetical protein [Anaeromyxobacteraceae bacterium]